MKTTTFAILAVLILCLPALAKHGRMPLAEKVQLSQVIVVGEVTMVEKAPLGTQGAHWTYSKFATVRIKQVLKGQVSASIKVRFRPDYRCDPQELKPGSLYLFYLDQAGQQYGRVNWNFGAILIRAGHVENPANPSSKATIPLAELIERIRALCPPPAPPCGLPVCPHSQRVPIIYGEPSAALAGQAEKGQIVLGGCDAPPAAPTWQCKLCGHRGRRLPKMIEKIRPVPVCGYPVCRHPMRLPIVYGRPGTKLIEKARKGQIVLGGCVIPPTAPTWQCKLCGQQGRRLDEKG